MLSTIFVGVGAAAVATGVVLYLTAPKTRKNVEQSWRVTPAVGDTWGFALSRGF
jgi:hypothetical protein